MNQEFVERVRLSSSIVELVGGYVQLRKRGLNYWALCPFHQEKTPSFSVNEQKQIFKCFGCGAGGDVFGFVQRIENLNFPQSVEFLANRYGIPLPVTRTASDPDSDERARLASVMLAASNVFREQLGQNSTPKKYLDDRGITAATIETFGLGYAPGGNRLLQQLQAQGVPIRDLEACGLAVRNEAGEVYDKFRNRVIFPIQDLAGKIIAFGGRILGDGQPKYLNSPETILYSKGHHLYGLYRSRDAIRQRGFAILVEGYFDCIVPFQSGVENVVASLGTSLTENQVRLLGRYTRQVIINFDPDSAGVAASLRSVDLCLEQGFRVNVARLPQGVDPDTFVRREGAQAYQAVLKQSVSFIEFLLAHQLSQHKDASNPKAKREICDQLIPYLLRIPNRIERAEYVARVSGRLQIDEALLLGELRRYRKPRRGEPATTMPKPRAVIEATPAEKILIAALLDPEFQSLVIAQLDETLLEGLAAEQVLKAPLLLGNQAAPIDVFVLREILNSEEVDLLERVLVQSSEIILNQESIERSIEALQDLQFTRLIRQIQMEIAQEEKSGHDSARLDDLLRQKETLQRQRKR